MKKNLCNKTNLDKETFVISKDFTNEENITFTITINKENTFSKSPEINVIIDIEKNNLKGTKNITVDLNNDEILVFKKVIKTINKKIKI